MPGYYQHIAWAAMPRRFAFDGYSSAGSILIASTRRQNLADYETWVSDGSPHMTPMEHYDWSYCGTLSEVVGKSINAQRPGINQIRKYLKCFAEVRMHGQTHMYLRDPAYYRGVLGAGRWRA